MTEVLQRSRTGWDIALGALLVIGSLVILGNAVLATAVSVVLIGWCVLLGGVAMLVAGLLRIRSDFSWSILLGGVALGVLGLIMLRNLGASAAALTMTAAAMFLATGLVRIFLAFDQENKRALLIFSGAVSVVLGLWILFNPGTATLTLLGTLLGIQVLVEGVTMILAGRLRLAPLEPSPATPGG
ncbi:DUF308 domain-containing protein [Ornithinimicrobium sp. F0845]|uniref:HdeD family acid-resistance protein n=1 Tax=Ornithinimicrobium sp. F0845 TaxID=2926412 RepID=UPI001FF2DBE2|nr:DUF308 domain-containing protein [Ornithinimicrobium sp. F0845]MCK0113591.1 DUF308 domain-containing protein [Ornithinimicrobium sp. F0845]